MSDQRDADAEDPQPRPPPPDTVEEAMEAEEAEELETGSPSAVRWLMYAAALGLLGVCIYLAIGQAQEGERSGWQRLSEADPRHAAGLLLLVAFNIAVNGVVFWAMVKPFERGRPVSLADMTALIGATALLNYLPARAGMIGRAAYLKRKHAVSYRASVVMLVAVAGGTMFLFAMVVAATLWRKQLDSVWWLSMAGVLVVAAVAAPTVVRLKLRWTPGLNAVSDEWVARHPVRARLGTLGLLVLRVLDIFSFAGRVWLAARIVGSPIDLSGAMLMATGGMFITLAAPVANGLGLREGLYGLFARAGVAGEALEGGGEGLTVALIDRAAEGLVFIVLGLLALAYLHRRRGILPDARGAQTERGSAGA
jgi:hypothetical protein